VVPAHGDVIVSEGSGDEVLRGEDVVAREPVSATMRQGIDARLATLTTLAKAGEASWCSGEDWIQGGA
jgi:hypothetical protein